MAAAKEGVRLLEEVFQGPLDGHCLISKSRGAPVSWQLFVHLSNATWYRGTTVLVGDAAHTTHFTIGSGTRLAMVDGILLAHSLNESPDVRRALHEYDTHRRAALEPRQARARQSMAWFEEVDRYLDQDAISFAYSMSKRQGVRPQWRQQLHRAKQIPTVRRARRTYDTARRWYFNRQLETMKLTR